jgi:hypothetical protein
MSGEIQHLTVESPNLNTTHAPSLQISQMFLNNTPHNIINKGGLVYWHLKICSYPNPTTTPDPNYLQIPSVEYNNVL